MPFTTTISPASEVADLKQPASLGLPTRLLPMLLVTATFVLANIIWSVYDHALPDWDCAEHILNGLAYKDLLKHPKLFNADWIHTFLSVNYLYPPATYVLSGLTKLVFGISPWVDGLLKAFYQAVLCLSIYGLTKDLLKSRIAATMAVISINLYPQTSIYSHQLMLDFPMLAMVALAVWCLIAWQEKATTKNTICLGLAIGLACLTKQLAGAFLLVPVLIVLINTLAKRQFDKTGKLLLAGAIAAVMALPWFLTAYPALQKLAAYNTTSLGYKGISLGFGGVLTYYLSGLPSTMSPILFAAFIGALCLSSLKIHRSLILVSAASAGGLILLSTLSWAVPLDRYALPSLIAPAVYTGSAFACAFSRKNKLTGSLLFLRCSLCILVITACLQFLLVNYSPYPLRAPASVTRALPFIGIGLRNYHARTNPEKYDWGQSWSLTEISKVDGNQSVYLNVMPNSKELNVHTLQYAGTLLKSPVIPTTMRQWSVTGDTMPFSPEKALYYQWYLIKTGHQGHVFQNNDTKESFDKLTNFVRTSGRFRLMVNRALPDGSALLLYRQK